MPAVVLAASLAAPGVAAGSGAGELAPGEVVVASPMSRLVVPTDGRIRGSGFDARVTGVGWPVAVRAGGHVEVASPSHRLVVFSLGVTEIAHTATGGTAVPLATAALDVTSVALPLPLASLDTQLREANYGSPTLPGTAASTFAASVPAGAHHVDLVVTANGYSQSFDLWTLRRVGPSPAALYRSPTGSFAVEASSHGAATLAAVDPAKLSAPISLEVRSAGISEFPDASGTPPPPRATEAYLDVELLGTAQIDATLTFTGTWGDYLFSPLPGDRVTFTPAGGHRVRATAVPFPGGSSETPEFDDGLFDSFYDFLIPAATTSGTLSVVGGTFTGKFCTSVCTPTTPSVLLGGASIPLRFPAVPVPRPRQVVPPWVGRALPPTGAAALAAIGVGSAAPHLAGGVPPVPSGGFPIWAAVLLVLAAVAIVLGGERLVRHRRRLSGLGLDVPLDVGSGDGSPPRPAGQGAVVAEPATFGSRPPVDDTARHAPGVPPLGGDGVLVVRVLGPVEITGWERPTERVALLEAICSFLCLHPERPRSAEQLQRALEPAGDDQQGTAKTIRNYLWLLRRAVGAEHLADAGVTRGYRLVGAVSDWGRFCELTDRARAEDGDTAQATLAEALSHVRGVPFEGAPPAFYAFALDTGLAHEMTARIVDVAHRLSTARLAAGDPGGAVEAARLGQRASREDFALWRDLFAASRANDGAGHLRELRTEAARVLGEQLAARLFSGVTPFSS